MMYSELVFSQNGEILDKTAALAVNLQRNLNNRLDGLIFRAETQASFNAGIPHADNVISLVQVDSTEINIYKGDTRIVLGGGSIPTDHALIFAY